MKSIKLLCVVILGMVVGGAECAQQTVFDLPPNTPGLRNGNTQYKTVKGIQNQECVHVIVPGSEAANAVGVARAMMMNGNIYFPKNGAQPTTPEAVEYSCANIDNRENSPITDWYMQIFGVVPFRNTEDPANDYIKAGWDHDAANAQRIISFDASVDDTMVDDPNIPGAQISRRALFEREFRKIASTSVGRVLLYRILIEIRRHRAGSDEGYQEDICACPDNFVRNARNKVRCVKISWNNSFGFDPLNGDISICDKNIELTVVGRSDRRGFTHIAPMQNTPIHVLVTHEMLHWFHSLRNKQRTQQEYDNYNIGSNACNYLNFGNYYVGQYYWGKLNCILYSSHARNRMNVSAEPWLDGGMLRFEEIRTILGFPSGSADDNYLQGDDLSENLYRMCVGFPLRFGYGYQGFYEDRKVVNRITNSCFAGYIYYVGGTNTIKRRIEAGLGPDNLDTTDLQYDDPIVLKGLGNFRCVDKVHWIPHIDFR